MRPIPYAVLALLLASALVLPAQERPTLAVESLITVDSLAAGIRFLSDDLLEGRAPGTRGDRMTRLWLATEMRLAGLSPAGPNGSFEQPVRLVGITAKVTAPLRAQGPKGDVTFEVKEDFVANAGRPEAQSLLEEAEVVFVGYGIDAPEERWDDFKGMDLKDKVLLVMNNDPADDPALFAGTTRLYYGRWSYKYEEAARRGAKGAIVIHTTESAGYPFQVIQAGSEREDFSLPADPNEPALAVEAWCSEGAASKLCELGGFDLSALRKQAETREFRPVPLGVKVSLRTENTVRELESANVLGMLKGSDPELANTYVVVTAHFDHLGIGDPKPGTQDRIYNGALDNATGVTAMMNIARAIQALPERPKRSILFAGVAAEESGLLGSLHFARNPTVPAKAMVANFNIDGINIYGQTKDIGMVGYGKNSLTALAADIAQRRGRELVKDSEVDKGLFYRSDHFSFARIGVPSAYFKPGSDFLEDKERRQRTKLLYTAQHYHQPSDEFHEAWNLEGAVDDVRLLLECLVHVANDQKAPTWTPGDEFERFR